MANVHGKNVQRVAFLPYLLYVGYEALYPQKAIAILMSLVNAAPLCFCICRVSKIESVVNTVLFPSVGCCGAAMILWPNVSIRGDPTRKVT